MVIGILKLQVSVFDSFSLKDKRRVIKSLKDRIHHTFFVSIAEVEHQDSIRTSILGVALVTNERRFADSVLSKIVDFVRKIPQLSLVDYEIELL
jgi:uncharacterized protein